MITELVTALVAFEVAIERATDALLASRAWYTGQPHIRTMVLALARDMAQGAVTEAEYQERIASVNTACG